MEITNVLNNGGPKTKERRLGLEIVRVCFINIEVGDYVLGVFCQELFQVKLLDK